MCEKIDACETSTGESGLAAHTVKEGGARFRIIVESLDYDRGKDVGLKQWVREIDKKVDNILEFMHKMEVHLDYTSKRIDTQCEKLANQDNRLKAVEDEIQKHKGELTMLKWILSGIGVVAAVAVPIIMIVKGS